jgi:hypothetical protein
MARGVDQVVESLLSNYKTLSLSPNTIKNKRGKEMCLCKDCKEPYLLVNNTSHCQRLQLEKKSDIETCSSKGCQNCVTSKLLPLLFIYIIV